MAIPALCWIAEFGVMNCSRLFSYYVPVQGVARTKLCLKCGICGGKWGLISRIVTVEEPVVLIRLVVSQATEESMTCTVVEGQLCKCLIRLSVFVTGIGTEDEECHMRLFWGVPVTMSHVGVSLAVWAKTYMNTRWLVYVEVELIGILELSKDTVGVS